MAGTSSTMLELGTAAPDFSLPDTNGNPVSRQDFRHAPGLMVIFLCNHCSYVHHIRKTLVALAREYQSRGLAVVAINANDITNYPEDGPDKMAEETANSGYSFPYLLDETQEVAKAYRAACTPDFFLFDSRHRLVYRGRFDASRPKNDLPVTGEDLRSAADALLSGQPIDPDQKPSFGCDIKWKMGNEPDYFKSIRLKPSLALESDEKVAKEALLSVRDAGGPLRLEEEQLEKIGEYVRAHLADWLAEAQHDAELRKRITRVEKDLRNQRESIKQGFEHSNAADKQLGDRIGQSTARSVAVAVGVGLVVLLISMVL